MARPDVMATKTIDKTKSVASILFPQLLRCDGNLACGEKQLVRSPLDFP
jgi:hypothetical protein